MNEMYNRIVSAAAAKGWSVCDVAEKSGVHRTRIYALQKDADAKLSAANLRKVAAALNVPTDWLIFGDTAGRVIHINLEKKDMGLRDAVAKMTDRELMEFIAAFTAELQRRKDMDET